MSFAFYAFLFLDSDADSVLVAQESFLTRRGEKFKTIDYNPPHFEKCYHLFGPVGRWSMIKYEAPGPNELQREINFDFSQRRSRKGFYLWSPDGSYWCYEFFYRGEILDRFCSNPSAAKLNKHPEMEDAIWKGNTALLGEHFDWFPRSLMKAYLTQAPDPSAFPSRAAYEKKLSSLNVKIHPKDRFPLFSDMALLNFLSFLGISIPIDAKTSLQKAIVLG